MSATLPLSLWLSSAGANPAGWISPGAAFDVDFVNNRAYTTTGGVVLPSTLLTTVRASSKLVPNIAGTLLPIAVNTLPRTNSGVLPEPAATNLALQSQTLDSITWGFNNFITVSANSATAPDGTLTADGLIPAAGSHSVALGQANLTVVSASVYTYSAYFKYNVALGLPWVEMTTTGDATRRVWFNTLTGAVGTLSGFTSATATALGNGWFRFTGTFTAASSTSSETIYSSSRAADNNFGSVTGDGVTPAYYEWGVQFELGPIATSYILTTTATVTRAADGITRSRTNPTVFTRVFSAVTAAAIVGTNQYLWALADGGGTNNIQVYRDGAGHIITKAIAGGVTYANLDLGLVANNTTFKVGIRMTASAFSAVLNGGAVSTAAGTAPTGMVTEYIGSDRSSANQWNSFRKRDTEFSTNLTDARLQALTT